MTIETQSPRDTSRCRITDSCGFTFCLTCFGNDFDDRPFACDPDHQNQGKESQEMATKTIAKKTTVSASKAEPPPQMQREDRRIVADKIADVYDDSGYIAPWTDDLVARDLGVPCAWVAEVRDFMFGPANENPNLAENRRRFSEWSADYEKFRAELVAHTTQGKRLRNTSLDLQVRADEIRAQQNRIIREGKL
ncbi:hypothetical protein [Martelella soudanensis]|uniref:hypothetical protein n=1 Tax=unclassified Martelella TaxID=2629616 RepID=UPI0015DDE03E|nr:MULTISPECIES: hypothetical protein [unclassified Martelella]